VRLSAEKAGAVAARHPGAAILSGDTVVAAGRRILPKAEDAATARACLKLLSGRRHRVLSAVTLVDAGGTARHRLSTSIVLFKPLHPREIDAYVDSGEWHGKAGGYAIQGKAAALIRWMSGSPSGVIGLPLFETRALLVAAGLIRDDG
jgi:septum formation protein